MFNIKTLNKISASGLSVLDKARYSISDGAENPDGILVRSADMLEYQFNGALCCIARAGAGVNNIPISRCSESGIVVFNTPGANANAVKELVICALLLSSRDIVGGIEWAKGISDKGDEVGKLVEKGKSAFVGPEIEGKAIGVIGLGAIGLKVANAAEKLGMTVYGYDPYLASEAEASMSGSVKIVGDLETIYKNCDYITVHVPASAETKGMINKAAIGMMKDEVRIVNLARGELVNSTDIREALESGKVAKYVTDFPDAIALNTKNVIAIPHLGASTPESEENCAYMAAAQLKDYLESGNIKNSVNIPNVSMEASGAARVCLFHKNVPGMIEEVKKLLASKGIKILSVTSKAKKDFAYALIDVDSEVSDMIADEIRALEGSLKVRVLNH